MSEKSEKAKELFKRGYNCSQAVVGAFAEELGMDKEALLRLSSSFGGGMGRLREVCGAVSGMFMVAGLKYGYASPDAKEEKGEHYARIQEMAKAFTKENGSIICRELLGTGTKTESPVPSDRTDNYYKTRPCADLVADAAKILEEYIKAHG